MCTYHVYIYRYVHICLAIHLHVSKHVCICIYTCMYISLHGGWRGKSKGTALPLVLAPAE